MDARDNEEFTARLLAAVEEVWSKYKPHQFKRMLGEYGGFGAVSRVLSSGKTSDGFASLWELGRLDLTCEAIVVEEKWRLHFDVGLLAKAEKNLMEAGYPFKRFNAGPRFGTSGSGVTRGTSSMSKMGPLSGKISVNTPLLGTGINAFFNDVLNAPVSNGRWSWGSVDHTSRRVFLRLWQTDIGEIEGTRTIQVLSRRGEGGNGWNERLRHLDLVRQGYVAYAVMCEKVAPEHGTIKHFDRESIVRLGRFFEHGDVVEMEAVQLLPVGSLPVVRSHAELPADVADAMRLEVSETTRQALVDARLGQGRFRRELMRRWDGACAVTGCRLGAALRASHCKPWRRSDNAERLDSSNGLVLTATLDALFDVGLISFRDDGEMLVAEAISMHERVQLGLPSRLLTSPWPKLRHYLRYHRDYVFLW